jgi:hypothetical protein
MKPNMICCSWWEQNGHHMPTWITGPSASGSEYGTPTSITSEPHESSIFNAFDVVSKSGSPAVMNGMNAVWKFPGLDRPLMQNFYSKNANATLRHGIRQDHSNWRLAIWPPISILSSWYTNFLVQIICIKEHITQNDTLVLHIHIKVVYWCTSCQSWARRKLAYLRTKLPKTQFYTKAGGAAIWHRGLLTPTKFCNYMEIYCSRVTWPH